MISRVLNSTHFIYSDGITMVGFQRLGTVRGFKFEQRPLPVVKDRNRSGSDPLHLYSSSPDDDVVGSTKYDELLNHFFFFFVYDHHKFEFSVNFPVVWI